MTRDELEHQAIYIAARVDGIAELFDAAQGEGLKPGRAANAMAPALDDLRAACDRLIGSIASLEK